jgi:hypothetical protein
MLFHRGLRHKIPAPIISAPMCTHTVRHPVAVLQFFSELRKKKKIKKLHETFLFIFKHKCLRISEMSGTNNAYINKLIFSSVMYIEFNSS